MTDRLDRRMGPARGASLRTAALLAAMALAAGCQPLDPAQPLPVPPDGGTPCTRAVAVRADSVVIAAGACNPWCLVVAAGTPVTFFNNDAALYYFVATPALPYDVQVPGYAGMMTLPLPVGTWTWTALQSPATTATVFVE